MSEDLHVFSDDYEWIVAKDLNDCKSVLEELKCYPPEGVVFEQLDDNASLSIFCDVDGNICPPWEGNPIIKTNREWAQIRGRGYLCTSEC